MSRKTDLLAMVSAARPDQLEPPADPGRLERFRTAAMSGEARSRPRGGFWRPMALGTASALLAVLVVVVSLAGRQPVRPSARQTLLAAATALEAGGTASGRYWTADLRTHTVESRDTGTGPPLYRYSSTCDARLWGARSSRDTSWLIVASVTDQRPTEADERAWRQAGSPGATGCQLYTTSIGLRSAPPAALELPRGVPARPATGPAFPTVANVAVGLDRIAALPTEPAALKAALDDLWVTSATSAGRTVPPFVTVQEVADLLVTVPTPPATQAALYRVLAGLPISRSRGTVTDRLGRRGVAFRTRVGATELKLIIDPRTGHPLAVESSTSGRLDGYTLIRHQGWTDRVPDLPAGRL